MEMMSSISYKRIGRLLVILLGTGFLGCCFLRYCSPNYYSAFLYIYILPVGILAGGVLIRSGEVYQERSFQILALFYLWYLAAILLNEGLTRSPGENWRFILVAASQLFLLFPMGVALAQNNQRKTASLFAWISVGIVSVLSFWAIFQCLIDRTFIPGFENHYGIGTFVGRLVIFANPNPTGMVCAISAVLAGFLFCTQKAKSLKTVAAVCMAVCYTATALTESRTALLSVGIGFGCMTFRKCYLKILRKSGQRKLLYPIFAAASVAAAAFLLYRPIVAGFSMVCHSMVTRSYVNSDCMITGRDQIWRIGIAQMNATARSWLIGFSPNRIGEQIGDMVYEAQNFWTNELHNSYLQVLMGCGLPGLLLLLLFLVHVARTCVAAMLYYGDPEDWSSYLTGTVAAAMTMALAETFFFSYDQMHFVNFWFFAASGTLCGMHSCRVKELVFRTVPGYLPGARHAGAYAFQYGTLLREPMER